jgi:hypothetical protein
MGDETAVYVIGSGRGPRKIGIAVNPVSRLRRLQTGSAARLTLQHQRHIARALAPAVEAYAHWLLRDHKQQGEWFRVSAAHAIEALDQAEAAVARGERAERLSVGRPKLNFDLMPGRFPEGTFARIDAVRREGENRSDFLKAAVEAELKRREAVKQ